MAGCAQPTGAERATHREFCLACVGSNQHQIGDVRPGDQQHQSSGCGGRSRSNSWKGTESTASLHLRLLGIEGGVRANRAKVRAAAAWDVVGLAEQYRQCPLASPFYDSFDVSHRRTISLSHTEQPAFPTSDASEGGFSRRSFLLAAAGLGAGAMFGAPFLLRQCRGPVGTAEGAPYTVWRELQQALRASPDHAPGRAAALLREVDAYALHRFVRDEIRLVSADGSRFQMGNAMPIGVRAALRAGAGTAREKAEILAYLLRESGLQAEVMDAPAIARTETRETFFRATDQPFAPPIDAAQIRDWARRLGLSAGPGAALNIDPDGRRAEALAEMLYEQLGDERASIGRTRFDDRGNGAVPLVRYVDVDGRERWADPIRPAGAITETAPPRIKPAAAAGPALAVEVVLSASFSEAPRQFSELVSGRWNADQVCGRQLKIGFRSPLSLAEWAASRLVDLRCFVPQIMLQALDLERAEASVLSFAGDAFSLDGQRYAVADDGSVSVDGRALLHASSEGSDFDAAAARVRRLELSVDSSRFPELRLRLKPLDAREQVVDGLPAAAL